MKNRIIVVFSSHLGDVENEKFKNHIYNTIGNIKHFVVCIPNYNEFSLPKVYNNALLEYNNEENIIVFMHPDIIIKTKNWGKLLLNHFNYSDYGILGIAGTTFLHESGVWWSDRSKMYGIVSHTDGLKEWTNEYSQSIKGIQPVVVIDGLFMAIDPQKIVHNFDENYGKYHFYEIPMVIKNYIDATNIGVISNISVLHKSIGQTNQSWEDNRLKFEEEYKDLLPLRHISEDKLKVLICCQFFKSYTGSEMSNYELSKELVKLGCDVTVISSVVGNPLYDKAKKNGVKVYSFTNLPNYILDQEGRFNFIKNEAEFDIIHINHKPIGELILQLYPNTPAVMHVRSEVIPIYEVPIIHPAIKKYISIRESITEYIKSFGIAEENIVTIENPFDIERFNTKYIPIKNEKEVVLFVGTIDYLRTPMIFDLITMTRNNNQELWIIGDDGNNVMANISDSHVKYLGIKSNVEDYIKKCDYTAGIYRGRTTIEGYLCGKPGWIYTVDLNGNIVNKELTLVPENITKYSSKYSANEVFKLYEDILSKI